MKNITTTTKLLLCFATCQTYALHSFLHDDFEEEFIARINHVEKTMKETEESIQAQLKEFHNKFFHDFKDETKDFKDYAHQNSMMGNQNYMQHYQQTSSSLSFGNHDMAVKIMEQKDNATKMYTIIITNKKDEQAHNSTSGNQASDIAIELKELASYIKKAFHSQPAEKILDECISAIAEEHKDSLVNIASSTHGNQRKYTIEIAHKKEPVVADFEPSKKNRRNKKNR